MTTNQRLSVLHVIYKVQPTNGQFNEHVLPFAAERDLTVCSFRPSTLPIPPTVRSVEGDGSFGGGVRALRRALKAAPHDVVHVHAAQTAALLAALTALRPATRARSVYTIQNSFENYRRRNQLFMAFAVLWYPQVVFCSTSALGSVPRWFRRLIRGAVHVVPNCVDLTSIDRALASAQPPPVPARPDHFRVGVLGRLMPIKDVATVIRAVASSGIPGVELVIIGEGPCRGELDALIARLGVEDRVTFTGLLERSDVYRQTVTADIVVSASHGEGLPVAVVESLACRRCVILTDIAPHRELTEGLEGARLFGVGDVAALAAHLREAAASSREQRDAVGESGRRHVDSRYGLDAMHRRYEAIYSSAAGHAVTSALAGGTRTER